MTSAIRFSAYGGPDVLELVQVDVPVPGDGQVLVRVRAAGVNPSDWKRRKGLWAGGRELAAPSGIGNDLAGIVEAVGPGVSSVAVGDHVLGTGSATHAELALARPASLTARPSEIPWEVAGGVGVAGRTAYRVLRQLGIGPGDTLLIHAAAGGVGIVATQLALAWGATVVGTAGSDNQAFVRELGASPVRHGDGWEDRVRAAAPDGVDAVLDASGRGELAASVALAGGPERVLTIAAGDADEHGVRFSGSDEGVDVSDAFPELARRLAAGDLVLPVWRTYPLAEAAEAHRVSEAGHLRGKIVLLP
ncbi:NADP-dependent oxidoreductase [Patulibacter sp.]|uniref:NADP-dependent oxidoreductase n=1 Tax=Patulibacter sp. TaxID=1912859 RepID=UPI0027286DC2|nr:NADP-dependent oxidoreductase [Patulibacter sp.]MDO9409898.1 NADP-dependent oxidoreductase [Patulibacter sp.]